MPNSTHSATDTISSSGTSMSEKENRLVNTRLSSLERTITSLIGTIDDLEKNMGDSGPYRPTSMAALEQRIADLESGRSDVDTLLADRAQIREQIRDYATSISTQSEESERRISDLEDRRVQFDQALEESAHIRDEVRANAAAFASHSEEFSHVLPRLKNLEILVERFYDSLNYFNRFQAQTDSLTARVEQAEGLLRTLDHQIRHDLGSKVDAVAGGTAHQLSQAASRQNEFERRLSAAEHTLSNFVSPKRFISAFKRKLSRKFGRSS